MGYNIGMDSRWDHAKLESEIYKSWEKSGAFSPLSGKEALAKKLKPFTIIMPPPNANDPLHVGHAMFVAVEDILIRYHRMLGEESLWVPGTDHAGIETQYVFEKKLAKQDKSRFDYDRETLYKMIWDYVQENGQVAVNQMKRLGASADWNRFKFTLDEDIVKLVLETFVKLHKDNLIYRAEKLVNYCTKCGTSYSELEVNHEERGSKLYIVDYGLLKVATTRPETMLGDVAVAVNPTDKRYKKLIGKEIDLPLTNRKIPIIADKMVDVKFGTGAVKITPAHDVNDWEVAERVGMNLQEIVSKYQIINEQGKMTANAGADYEGLSVLNAREKVIFDLGDKLVETKDYHHSVGVCYRCNRIIEPLPKSQFFIKVKPLTEKVIKSLDDRKVKIHGSGREKVLRHWLTNLRDWNISRQIVWGIRMPIWYKDGDKTDYAVSIESPGKEYVQEADTFDTWFSSGQWPVVTLKTSKQRGDFDFYYPTLVMETGYDILPFWVMRMLMLGIYLTGKAPFKDVYLHGLVRDEKGQKMSKSKGNVINPIDMVDKYGADAIRMALVMNSVAGQDKAVSEEQIRGMRNFANKIWNAARFIKENGQKISEERFSIEEEFDKKLEIIIKTVNKNLEKFRIGMAAEIVYNEFWHWFCDEAIEKAKRGEMGFKTLKSGLMTFLKLLHPFMPFVTEAVWKEMGSKTLLISEKWPRSKE
jgi:valyl-tRNA synthetase